MPICHGNGSDHCCWINGKVCPHLEENTVPGRRWACGLLRVHGDWETVYQTPEYQATDAATWFASSHPGYGCGDWPQNIPPVIQGGVGLCCWSDT